MPRIRTPPTRERPLTSAKHRVLAAAIFWEEPSLRHAQDMHRAHMGAPANFRESPHAAGSSILAGVSHAPCTEYAPRLYGSAC